MNIPPSRLDSAPVLAECHMAHGQARPARLQCAGVHQDQGRFAHQNHLSNPQRRERSNTPFWRAPGITVATYWNDSNATVMRIFGIQKQGIDGLFQAVALRCASKRCRALQFAARHRKSALCCWEKGRSALLCAVASGIGRGGHNLL